MRRLFFQKALILGFLMIQGSYVACETNSLDEVLESYRKLIYNFFCNYVEIFEEDMRYHRLLISGFDRTSLNNMSANAIKTCCFLLDVEEKIKEKKNEVMFAAGATLLFMLYKLSGRSYKKINQKIKIEIKGKKQLEIEELIVSQ